MRYIKIGEEVLRVKDFDEETKLKQGYAYVHGDMVYPYKGKLKKRTEGVGIYKDDGEYIFIRPVGKMKKKYSLSKVYTLDVDYIAQIINVEGLKDITDEALTSEMGEIFIPSITDDDNELQRAVKIALGMKKIDLKNYMNRFKSQTDMNNNKRALLMHGSMSMDKFNKWSEVLDFDYEIRIFDKPNAPNPMKEEILITNIKEK